jgi:hypothetical protein
MRRDKQKKDTAQCKPRKLSTGFYYFKQRSENVPFFGEIRSAIKESDLYLRDIVGICSGELDILTVLPVCFQQNAR